MLWNHSAAETWRKNLKEQIDNEKQRLLMNVGPEIVELIKQSQDCRPSCRQINKAKLQQIERYRILLRNLSDFQWCNGCATYKACTNNCGPKFWKLTRALMRDFKGNAFK
jgi:hypothetical protein